MKEVRKGPKMNSHCFHGDLLCPKSSSPKKTKDPLTLFQQVRNISLLMLSCSGLDLDVGFCTRATNVVLVSCHVLCIECRWENFITGWALLIVKEIYDLALAQSYWTPRNVMDKYCIQMTNHLWFYWHPICGRNATCFRVTPKNRSNRSKGGKKEPYCSHGDLQMYRPRCELYKII